MFLVDDILLAPVKFPAYICRQIHRAAEQELLDDEKIKSELSDLYMMLETGKITEKEFSRQEKELLARLEAVEEYKRATGKTVVSEDDA